MRRMLVIILLLQQVLLQGRELPDSVIVRTLSREHVQGVALDQEKDCYYVSFTTSFLKVDFDGNVLAGVDSLNGHLGALTFDPVARKVYASLECKDDEIGRNISSRLGADAYARKDVRFYIAVIDVDKLDSTGTPAGKVMKTCLIKEAVQDYKSRYGCSGIDGVALAPKIGKHPGKQRLYVAYGIYGDTSRTDNDHQIILEYKLSQIGKKPAAKYFVYTGNTSYGIQNMAYDPATGNLVLACYRGKKRGFPNHTIFALPVNQNPERTVLTGLEEEGKHLRLRLDGQEEGIIPGWNFSRAATGICTPGGGLWYNSIPLKRAGGQTCIIRRINPPWTTTP